MQKRFDNSLSIVMEDIKSTITTKFKNYGHANILEYGTDGVLLRMTDKFNRLRTMIGNNSNCVEEPRLDTWRDIVGYGLIGMMLEQSLWPGQDPGKKACTPKYQSIYVAGPIDMCNDFNYVDRIMDLLNGNGVDVFFPQLAYKWGKGDGKYIKEVNKAALLASDAVMVCLPDETPTFGTIYELYMALETGKPVAVCNDYAEVPMYLRDERIKLFNTLEETVNYLTGR